jgi:uncharacterized protein
MNSTTAESGERPTVFLDTNVLLGYFLDEEDRSARCLRLLQQAERGEVRLRTSALVLAEVVWTLQSSRFGLSPSEIRDLLMPVVTLRGLLVEDKQLYGKVLQLYCEHNIDFTDAYNAALMWKEGLTNIYSYDRHYDRMTFVQRVEP